MLVATRIHGGVHRHSRPESTDGHRNRGARPAQQKCDQIVPPHVADVASLFGQLALPADAVVRVGGDVEYAAHGGEAAQLLQDRGPRRSFGGMTHFGDARRDGYAEGDPERYAPEGFAQEHRGHHRRLTR
jgi:hypothetical protein